MSSSPCGAGESRTYASRRSSATSASAPTPTPSAQVLALTRADVPLLGAVMTRAGGAGDPFHRAPARRPVRACHTGRLLVAPPGRGRGARRGRAPPAPEHRGPIPAEVVDDRL